jgi:GLPGLI family protein
MKYLIFFLLFSWNSFLTAQNLFIEYDYYRNFLTAEHRARIAALQPDFLKKMDNEYDRFEMIANATQSRYHFSKLMFKDSLLPKLKSNRTCATIYLNLAQKYIYHTYESMPEKIGRDTLLQLSDWRIVEGEKQIAGYTCKKATRKDEKGNEIVAWFTLDIPIQQGPNGIYGLPGFVLGVEDKYFNIIAHKILFLPDTVIKMPTSAQYVTLKQLYELEQQLTLSNLPLKTKATTND